MAVLAIVIGGANAVGGGGWGGLLGGITPLHLWGGLQPGPEALVEPAGGDAFFVGPGGIAHGEYYRLLTSMFLHYGLFHLLLNMYALWVVGGVLEPLLGRLRFAALYLLAGLGGGVATYVFSGLGTVAADPGGVRSVRRVLHPDAPARTPPPSPSSW